MVSSRSRCARRQSQPRWGGINKASGRHPFLSDAARSRRGTLGLPRSRQVGRAETRLCRKQTHRPPCRREGRPAEARPHKRGYAKSSRCRSPGDVHIAGSRWLLQVPEREEVVSLTLRNLTPDYRPNNQKSSLYYQTPNGEARRHRVWYPTCGRFWRMPYHQVGNAEYVPSDGIPNGSDSFVGVRFRLEGALRAGRRRGLNTISYRLPTLFSLGSFCSAESWADDSGGPPNPRSR